MPISLTIDRVIASLLLAALVSLVSRRLRIPYTVGLLLAGIGLAALHVGSGEALSRDLIYKLILPPLIFEASLNTQWESLRKNLSIVLILATLGVLVASFVVSVGMHAIAGWPWEPAILLAVLLSATDPVAVLSVFKDLGISGRFRSIIEAESLLNDGTAATLFTVVLIGTQSVSGGGFVPSHWIVFLGFNVVGGIGIGAVVAVLALLLAAGTEDYLVETSLTTAAAYGSFLLADTLGASGILATVAAGMVLGNARAFGLPSRGWLSPRGLEVVDAFWEFAAFAANSIVFLMIGSRAAHILMGRGSLFAISLAVVLVFLARAAAVYPISAMFGRSHAPIKTYEQHLLFWGGLRGALALALALSLPKSYAFTDQIVVTTFGVVTVSVFVQGLSMPRFVKYLAPRI